MSPRIIPASGLSAGGVDAQQPGIWVPFTGPSTFQTATVPTASQARVCRFVCPRSMTIVSFRLQITAAATNDDQCDVGIYRWNTGAAVDRLGSSGAVNGKMNAVGSSVIPLAASVALAAGQVYFAAFVYGTIGGTAATIVQSSMSAGGITGLPAPTPGLVFPYLEAFFTNAAFPLPASLSATSLVGQYPIMFLSQ